MAKLHHVRSGSGEPLLLIMGMSGTHLSWGPDFVAALERDFDVVRYDHRGVGTSEPLPEGLTVATYAEDAIGLLDELGWESAHVCGISMGGMVAQELALSASQRIRSLVLGCTYAGGDESTRIAAGEFEPLAQAMAAGDREAAIRAGWQLNVSASFAADEAAFAAHRERALAIPVPVPTVMAQGMAVIAHDTRDRLSSIDVPTLVVHGTADRMLPYANAAVLADGIPGARLETLDGVGHMFWIEQPERSAALVRAHAAAQRGDAVGSPSA